MPVPFPTGRLAGEMLDLPLAMDATPDGSAIPWRHAVTGDTRTCEGLEV
jgi:hypothetical protein